MFNPHLVESENAEPVHIQDCSFYHIYKFKDTNTST